MNEVHVAIARLNFSASSTEQTDLQHPNKFRLIILVVEMCHILQTCFFIQIPPPHASGVWRQVVSGIENKNPRFPAG